MSKYSLPGKKKNRPQLFQEIALWVAVIMNLIYFIQSVSAVIKYFSKKKRLEK